MMECYGCGVKKDMTILEQSPYWKEDCLSDEPIPPLCVIECQSDTDHTDFRNVVVCHKCYHTLEPDMWISESMYKALNPKIPFQQVPQTKVI